MAHLVRQQGGSQSQTLFQRLALCCKAGELPGITPALGDMAYLHLVDGWRRCFPLQMVNCQQSADPGAQ